jgi:hypothetical protein
MANLGTPKKRPLFRGGRYSEVPPIQLDVWGSGLLTGGRCSEVVINTGLTVIIINILFFLSGAKLDAI